MKKKVLFLFFIILANGCKKNTINKLNSNLKSHLSYQNSKNTKQLNFLKNGINIKSSLSCLLLFSFALNIEASDQFDVSYLPKLNLEYLFNNAQNFSQIDINNYDYGQFYYPINASSGTQNNLCRDTEYSIFLSKKIKKYFNCLMRNSLKTDMNPFLKLNSQYKI
ncbi:MAG: hypothetical protein GY830_05650 [Bacteroidetes bacterium]|nr:hypothetical protein [Bacteroidota bacterium]